jgi:hypothetical protein
MKAVLFGHLFHPGMKLHLFNFQALIEITGNKLKQTKKAILEHSMVISKVLFLVHIGEHINRLINFKITVNLSNQIIILS